MHLCCKQEYHSVQEYATDTEGTEVMLLDNRDLNLTCLYVVNATGIITALQ